MADVKSRKFLLIFLLVLEVLFLGFVVSSVRTYWIEEGVEVFGVQQGLAMLVMIFLGYLIYTNLRERRMQKQVVGEKVKTAQLIQSLPQGVVILDGEGAILAANDRACALLQADSVMCLGRPISGWIDEASAKKLGEGFAGQIGAITSKGAQKIRLNVLPLHQGSGHVVSIDEDRAGTMKVLKQAPAGTGGFARSRELFDRLYAALVETGATADALVMARRLRSFAESAADADRAPARRPGDLMGLVRDAAGRLEPIRAAKGLKLEVKSEGDTNGAFDPDRLGGAVEEVLLNAMAYSKANGEIEVHVSGDARDLSLIVRDRGIGVEDGEVTQVFDPEFVGTHQRPETAGARGLGLTLARKIVEAHGGSMLFESRKDVGTRVSIAVPKQG